MNNVTFDFDETEPDSRYINQIWRTQSTVSGRFISQAVSSWEIVFTTIQGRPSVTLLGPETQSSLANSPANAQFVGIQFKVGTYMPRVALSTLVNGHVALPNSSKTTFWLDDAAWEIPTYETADVFVERLIKRGLLIYDPLIGAALENHDLPVTERTIQRRFKQVTGLTLSKIRQIERAIQAQKLLQAGVSILDTVFQTGYADQAHLTRALKQYVGQTPGQIRLSR